MANRFDAYGADNKRDMSYEPGAEMSTGFVLTVEDAQGNKGYKLQVQQISVERYQYFGMTKSAAYACAEAENALTSGSPDGTSTSYTAQAARQADSDIWNTNVTKTTIAITWRDVF